MPDAADQQAQPERDDREDRDLGGDARPVGAHALRQREQHEQQQHDDHHRAYALAPVEPGRRPGGPLARGAPRRRSRLDGPPRDRLALAREPQQGDGREHERRHVAVLGDRQDRRGQRRREPDHECRRSASRPRELSRAISAAASDEITRKVSVAASSPTRFDSSSPATPEIRPDTSHADASTRRTGTPSVAVISRSLASPRMAVPSFVKRRNSTVPTVTTTPKRQPEHLGVVDEHVADLEVLGRGRQDHRARLVAPDPRHRRRAGSAPGRASPWP